MADSENQSEKADIGSELRAAREASGARIEDIAAILRIRSDHLLALEEDDYDRLPGSVYAIGFIRTYATHLNINAAELIGRYKATVMAPQLSEQVPESQMEVDSVPAAVKIAIIVAAILLIYLMWLMAGGARGPETSGGTKAPESPNIVRDTPPVEPPAPAPTAIIRPVPDAATVPPPAIQVQPTVELEPVIRRTVGIRATRRTWMRIENSEGQVLFSSIIRANETFELSDDAPYTLATRDAGALAFFIDDETVTNVGRRGQILTARQIERSAILATNP